MMGMGPMKYCIVNNWMPDFESKLLLLVLFLPHKKMCLYPPKERLVGPFAHSPWLEVGDEIRSHYMDLKNSLLRAVFYTQQFVILTKIGIYGPSY